MTDRTTIDFGIDLGTTNSAVAVLRGVNTEVVKNNEGSETTPSAVWVDRRGRVHVGRRAKDRQDTDPDNACLEFKLRMGTAGAVKTLAGVAMTPELLSAEVLRSLRVDVRERLGEEPAAAVITVPAAFDLSACDATRRAAELAGFRQAPLLSEPAAAAHAYGFQAAEDNATWLVYDLGGGTFDAAVIRLQDGEFSVARHAGDNFLGGKVIDWRIVDELLIPAAVREHPALAGLSRGDPRWFAAISALKVAAERAKIDVSRRETAEVEVELIDDRRQRYEFFHEISRSDVERIAEPVVARSINLCRDALSGLGIGAGDIAKVLMVGGQTAMPYVRDRLADPGHGLGIPLDFDEDPMTVVARGAAVFAGAQPLAADPDAGPAAAGEFTVELAYPPVGPDTDPMVAGKVHGPRDDHDELTVELVDEESDPPWRSGRIRLSERGHFGTTLWATPGRRHVYRIELSGRSGARLPITPDRLTYTIGGTEIAQVLGTTLGVGLDGNRMLPLIERGAPLPAERHILLRTTVTVQRGAAAGLIRIPVLEGDHARGDRNRRIGRLEVGAAQVERTVPAGSELKLTVHMNASRLIRTSVHIPYLDQTFERTIDLNTESALGHAELTFLAEAELARLATVRQRQHQVNSPLAELQLARIDDERIPADVGALVDAAKASTDDALAANKRIIDLRVAIDSVEDELRWPELIEEAEAFKSEIRDLVAAEGSTSDRDSLPEYERLIDQAVEARDADLLRQRIDELEQHVIRILDRGPVWQILTFQNLVSKRNEMRNPTRADTLIDEGMRSIDAGNPERLRIINPQLREQLPESLLGDEAPGLEVFSTVKLFR